MTHDELDAYDAPTPRQLGASATRSSRARTPYIPMSTMEPEVDDPSNAPSLNLADRVADTTREASATAAHEVNVSTDEEVDDSVFFYAGVLGFVCTSFSLLLLTFGGAY